MPDNVDFIQEQQAELLERQINAARVKHCGASALVCDGNLCLSTHAFVSCFFTVRFSAGQYSTKHLLHRGRIQDDALERFSA